MKNMKTIELFCGTKSFSKVAKELRHKTFTVDNNNNFDPDVCVDILNIKEKLIPPTFCIYDIVWMSPPCTTFSMASGNKHWTKYRQPKTDDAKKGKRLLEICWKIAKYCIKEDKIFFIENPRARARWFLPEEYRKTVWYCQYGDKRAKPTDIWTNLKGWQPKTCHNGNNNCHHQPAPRGSRTGTQGLKGAKERGVIPSKLFYEIFDVINKNFEK